MKKNRYNSWDIFLKEVVDTANKSSNLEQLFNLSSKETIVYVSKIIAVGWGVFSAVVAILALSGPIFLFAIGGLGVTPIGIALIALFGVSLTPILKVLYKNKQLPLAINQVGKKFKPSFDSILCSDYSEKEELNKQIDLLLLEAVKELISLAKNEAEKLKVKYLFEKTTDILEDTDKKNVTESEIEKILEVEFDKKQEELKLKAKEILQMITKNEASNTLDNKKFA